MNNKKENSPKQRKFQIKKTNAFYELIIYLNLIIQSDITFNFYENCKL